jgi:transcriptional regulator with XRE-family HTH domain
MLWRIYALSVILFVFLSISKLVGRNIRKFRLESKISQEKLAELSNLHPTFIGRLERGTVNVSLWSLEAIAKALRVKPGLLLDPEASQKENL